MTTGDAIISIFLIVMCLSMAMTYGITPELLSKFRLLFDFTVCVFLAGAINLFCGGAFNFLGITPRTPQGLLGIFLSSFLHGDWPHLVVNLIFLFPLGWLIILGGTDQFLIVTIFTALFRGFAVWLIGKDRTTHIGISGVVFGYLGFLLTRGYFARDSIYFGVSAIVGGLYGRYIQGIFPRWGISWEGHFFGLIGGVLAARYLVELKEIVTGLEKLLRLL
ncbi:MAG: rhomboid family intramembrane serine protease [Symploca sp. SIO2G7]|nr:rhomboid family intramembrane serine protease [Symploca sp. SIO2G7]